MSFFNTLATIADRVVTQCDEHTIAWSIADHANCVEDVHKNVQRLQKLQAKGANLDLHKAYNDAFALKTVKPVKKSTKKTSKKSA